MAICIMDIKIYVRLNIIEVIIIELYPTIFHLYSYLSQCEKHFQFFYYLFLAGVSNKINFIHCIQGI